MGKPKKRQEPILPLVGWWAVYCHAQDRLWQPSLQRATGRNIQRFSGTCVMLFTSSLVRISEYGHVLLLEF